MQIDVDKSEVHTIEDKVMQFIRTHGTGPVGMDTNNLGKEDEPWYIYPPGTPSWSWTTDDYHNGEEADGQKGGEVNAFGKAKDKGKSDGKGGFRGQCYTCGQYGHSQRFCPQKGKGNGKGKILEEKEIKEKEKEHTATIITHGEAEKDMDSEEKGQITPDIRKTITHGEMGKDTDTEEKE